MSSCRLLVPERIGLGDRLGGTSAADVSLRLGARVFGRSTTEGRRTQKWIAAPRDKVQRGEKERSAKFHPCLTAV
jgi:hypothetical protein